MENKVIEFMQRNEDMSPNDIDFLLEYMNDLGYLSEKGIKLQHEFWKIFWKNNKFKNEK